MKPIHIKDGEFKIFIMPHREFDGTRKYAFAMCLSGRAQFWLEPEVELSKEFKNSMSEEKCNEALALVQKHSEELIGAWLS